MDHLSGLVFRRPQATLTADLWSIFAPPFSHDVRIDEFIEATASGQASDKRRRLDELMHILQRGDRLVVSELSRLGRSLGQIVAILDALATADVAFVALKEHIRVEGTRDIQTKVLTTLFALFAEVERDLISERTREGLARARASGKKLGRPKGALGVSRLDGKEDDIRRFLELGVSKTAIAKITGVSRTPLYSFMSTRGLKPSPSRVFLHESCRYPKSRRRARGRRRVRRTLQSVETGFGTISLLSSWSPCDGRPRAELRNDPALEPVRAGPETSSLAMRRISPDLRGDGGEAAMPLGRRLACGPTMCTQSLSNRTRSLVMFREHVSPRRRR